MTGDRIKKLRSDRNLTRHELADILGISYSAISKYETHKRSPDKKTLLKIASYFNVNTDYLLGISNLKYRSEKEEEVILTDQEISIINDIRGLSDESKKEIYDYIKFKNISSG